MNSAQMKTAFEAAINAAPLAFPNGTSGKRWISDVWASPEELWAAHMAGIVVLSRCDLTSAFSDTEEGKARLAASELTHMNAVFHFVRMA